MSESGNYPPGAEHDPRAPYNQPENEECEDCLGEGTIYDQVGTPIEKCRRCEGTGVVPPPTQEEIDEARAEARFDQLHEEGRT